MIKLVSRPNLFYPDSVENFKILTNFSLYPDISLFWESDEGGTASMLDKNLVVSGKFNRDELCGFIKMLLPQSVFCGEENNLSCGLPYLKESVFVLGRDGIKTANKENFSHGDILKSDEIYDLLNTDGISLPEKEYFSVDYCRRLNRGNLCCYAERDLCAAVALLLDKTVLINGVVSRKKGYGSKALAAVIAKTGADKIFAVCRKELLPFYEKNGFSKLYTAAYYYRK